MHLVTCGKPGRRFLTPQMLKVLKLTFILLTVAFLQVSARGVGQTVTLSERNVSLASVFKKIELQTGYSFWYENKLLDNTSKVSIEVKDASLEAVLQLCFKNQ